MNNCTNSYVAGLRRRRAAAFRTPPLDCGHVDPWTCNCQTTEIISDSMADGAALAAEYLREQGFPGIFDKATCQAMWRRGHRDLSVQTFSYSHGEVG